jgi:mannose/fructose/N-acetylgalactosamine-specific phosphotransferase system component IID
MKAISEGRKQKTEMVQQTIRLYREIFVHVKKQAEKLDQVSLSILSLFFSFNSLSFVSKKKKKIMIMIMIMMKRKKKKKKKKSLILY